MSENLHNSINVEQAKAAQREQFKKAAEAAFEAEWAPLKGLKVDIESLQVHLGNLGGFAPNLMDDHFRNEVTQLIERLNTLLDGPMKDVSNVIDN